MRFDENRKAGIRAHSTQARTKKGKIINFILETF